MSRLLVSLALVAVILVAGLSGMRQDTSAGGPLYGDASCDGQINSIDAAVVLQYSAGLLQSLGCAANADVDSSGSATSLDSALILQYSAGLIDHLGPIGNETPIPLTSTNTPPPGATNTPVPTSTPPGNGTPFQHPEIYYNPSFWWTNTDIELQAGDRIDVEATGFVIYDNLHLQGVSADGDGPATGWGPCPDHSLVGLVTNDRPGPNADPLTLDNVICLGANFSGMVPTGGDLHISINDPGGFGNNVGQWYVTVTTY